MGDSTPEEIFNDECWVLYKDNPEWKDLTPVPQDDGPNPVVVILYSEKFQDVFDYFRAILKSGEKSARALKLTQDAVSLNPANYTLWQYRREILQAMNSDLKAELAYVKTVIDEHPKNYQVWHHRRVVVEWLNDPEDELNITAEVLEIDAKNYHAWQHRQWVVRTFGLFENELDYVTKLINEDVRNNSAWNQRYFVLSNITNFTANLIEKEIVYTISKIISVTKNESSWNYLRGILLHSEHGLNHPITIKFCEDLYDSGNRSPYLLAFLVDHAEEMIEKRDLNKIKYLNLSFKLCKELGEEHDTIRQEYWKYLAKRIKESAQE